MKDKKICNFLKQLRIEKGISQNALAEKLYLDRSVISKIENGRLPSTDILLMYSEIFDVSIEEIIYGERKNKQNQKQINKNTLKNYKKLQRLKNVIFIIILILCILIIQFLYTFYTTNYHKTTIYKLTAVENDFPLKDGIFIETQEKHYIRLVIREDYEIDKMTLYYLEKEKQQLIATIKDDNYLIVEEYSGYNDLIKQNDLQDIIDNMYLEIEYNSEKIETEINFKIDYTIKEKYETREEI